MSTPTDTTFGKQLRSEDLRLAVRNCRFVFEETQIKFAERLNVQQAEISKLESGHVEGLGDGPKSRLITLCSTNGAKFLAHGINAADLVCRCNRSADYPRDFRLQAEALARVSVGKSSRRNLLDVRIREAKLPPGVEAITFIDIVNGRRLMICLISSCINRADQYSAAADQIGWFFNFAIRQVSQKSVAFLDVTVPSRRYFSLTEYREELPPSDQARRPHITAYNFVQALCRLTEEIPHSQKMIADHMGVCPQTICEWKNGNLGVLGLKPETHAKLAQLVDIAEPIVRMRCALPHRLFLVSPLHLREAKRILHDELHESEIRFPSQAGKFALDIHCESAALDDGNHSHFFERPSSLWNLWVVLVDQNASLPQQLSEALKEVSLHGISRFTRRNR